MYMAGAAGLVLASARHGKRDMRNGRMRWRQFCLVHFVDSLGICMFERNNNQATMLIVAWVGMHSSLRTCSRCAKASLKCLMCGEALQSAGRDKLLRNKA